MSRVILNALRAREAEDRPVAVGTLGAGHFGLALVTQLAQVPGMRPAAVADLDVEVARAAYVAAGHAPSDVLVTEHPGAAADAVRARRPVVVPDGALLAALPLDATVDSTGVPDVGADVASRCLRAGQHVVMVNVEADCVVGAALRRLADASGVVYSLADGDQPSLICTLADWAASLGLQVIAGGKGSRHARRLETEAAPHTDGPPAPNRVSAMSREGTKAQIEMASAANCLGWGVDVRGLHQPWAEFDEIATLFGPRESGGLLGSAGRLPVADVVHCVAERGKQHLRNPVADGVFVVATSDRPVTMQYFRDKCSMPVSADGTRVLLWRPYHLVGIETPYSIAQAVLLGTATATPLPDPTVEVVAVAMVDLPAGAALDGMGGGQVLGVAEMASVATAEDLLPLGLAQGVRLRRPVAAGQPVTCADLEGPGDTPCWRLRTDVTERMAVRA